MQPSSCPLGVHSLIVFFFMGHLEGEHTEREPVDLMNPPGPLCCSIQSTGDRPLTACVLRAYVRERVSEHVVRW